MAVFSGCLVCPASRHAFKAELSTSQADLVPLKAPVFGIEALIADVSSARDLLASTVGEIEANATSPSPRASTL